MKLFSEIIYRYFRALWDTSAREELMSLVDGGRINPCRTIDLGCGTGANAIYLAQHGFDVTGVDYAAAAIDYSHWPPGHAVYLMTRTEEIQNET